MSQVFRCDFCGAEDIHLGAGRPRGWARCQMRRLMGGLGLNIVTFDSCDKCEPILDITLNKNSAIDMLKRMHTITEATAAGKKGDT